MSEQLLVVDTLPRDYKYFRVYMLKAIMNMPNLVTAEDLF